MADHSNIEWTDATWNPITGCSVLSPGCTRCYAMKLAGTRLRNHPSRAGLTRESKTGPVWNGQVRFNEQWLTQPLEWKRPRKIFVCAHGDLFHENVPDEWIDRVFAVMASAPQHEYQVLTKRAHRMRRYVDDALGRVISTQDRDKDWPGWPLPNVWLGVSAERQKEADERIPELLATPAAQRFISAEPLLGPLELALSWISYGYATTPDRPLDWVIVGGESGQDARPMHPSWARLLRDQCAEYRVPFFFKQWGSWKPSSPEEAIGNPYSGWLAHQGGVDRLVRREELYPDAGAAFVERVGKGSAGRLLDGLEHNGMPDRSAA
ncbi:phage Gp37/Gp68 family protein [Bradyrhizobium sp. 188]|uniref:phage Gp37/Gp68 family protein n=1 Tax=Bradyrhizobium sp. 188 TaxID=2782656 RepID=UPI001FF83AA6|nr:phage Gp37/Gp68 family protein [Bradyrhizobium sp. 188]MCK1501533.1 phage Gp37/Gp68 family protein [Bradyrhizobium sp. 188]